MKKLIGWIKMFFLGHKVMRQVMAEQREEIVDLRLSVDKLEKCEAYVDHLKELLQKSRESEHATRIAMIGLREELALAQSRFNEPREWVVKPKAKAKKARRK